MVQPDFSPALDDAAIAAARETYARDGIVQIASPLSSEAIGALIEFYHAGAAWSRVFNEGQRIWDIDPDKLAEFESADFYPDLQRKIGLAAQKGFQFQHDAVRVADEAEERAARGLIIDHLLDSLNSPPWLEVFRTITGDDAVALVDGQATRYLPGHFLTGHDDNIAGKHRVAAYVLGLTPRWRTEWGGLLQFHDANGDVERGILPRCNVINLFRVPRLHSVSPVSAFAGAPRVSFTGWVRHDD
mgnify:CR=1 FL=1